MSNIRQYDLLNDNNYELQISYTYILTLNAIKFKASLQNCFSNEEGFF